MENYPLRAMSLVSWGVERLTRFSLSLYLFRVIWLNVYKVLLCLHCWGITTIRCPSMLAYGLANNNLATLPSWLLACQEIETMKLKTCGFQHQSHFISSVIVSSMSKNHFCC